MKDLGLLALRVYVGASMAAHGAQKMFGWFGGGGLAATGKAFEEHFGYVPGEKFVLAAARTEIASGLLMAAGALGPIGPSGVCSTMIVAAKEHEKNGFFAQGGGYELSATYGVASAALALTGPGKYSFDHLIAGEKLNKPAFVALSLLGAVAGAFYVLSQRQPSSAPVEV